nr:MBL fold metallo-hydrolase [Nakamurella aerolata]
MFQANCYLVAADRGAPGVIVDPGEDALGMVRQAVQLNQITPAAVLLTHGHLDHVASAAAVGAEYDVPVLIHAGDEHLLDDPKSGLNDELALALEQIVRPEALQGLRPPQLQLLGRAGEDESVQLAGLTLAVDHTPGHTPGSVVYRLAAGGTGSDSGTGSDRDTAHPEILFTGDTLFAGSIGRTDLPGGDSAQLLDSIGRRLLTRPDDAVILPGHGPTSTIGAERAGNPFLAGRQPPRPA